MPPTDLAALLAANQAFYDAFEAGDMDAMSELWEHSDRVACTHPGLATLRGWGAIAGSWYQLFGGSGRLQFIVTNAHGEIVGDIGWVVCDENILGAATSGTVAALNLFSREGGEWQMIAHHGSQIA